MDDPRWPFDDWLRLAVTVLHMSPAQFWSTSLRDFLTLQSPPIAAPQRSDIEALMKKFPDSASLKDKEHE